MSIELTGELRSGACKIRPEVSESPPANGWNEVNPSLVDLDPASADRLRIGRIHIV